MPGERYYSPSSTPRSTLFNEYGAYFSPTPTPTPSPYAMNGFPPPPRPATTRGHHSRSSSYYDATASPRYRSTGEYATADPSRPPTTSFFSDRYSYNEAARDAAARRSSTKTAAPSSSRRASMSAGSGFKPPKRSATPSASSQQQPPPSRKGMATEQDRAAWKIPKGYNCKNWDPNETPILLLGSVFDANSLGRWIFDWTATVHGGDAPLAKQAGDLWLLVLKLFGEVARMERKVGRVRNKADREVIDDFLESGDRLIARFQDLLKDCELPMLHASETKKNNSLGKSAGVEFVHTLFGRDRKLRETEKFMQNVRTFHHRYDANCDEILKSTK